MNHRREPLRVLVFAASLRVDSINARLARLAATVLEQLGASVDHAAMRARVEFLGEHPDPAIDRVDT